MKKIHFLFAAAALVLASCSNEEYLGDNNTPDALQNAKMIAFSAGSNATTRADITGDAAAALLGKAFKVYGVKQTAANTYGDVFKDYTVSYDGTKSAQEDFNDGWYYVGAAAGQTIKYWDYASADYRFVAGSPVANFTYTGVTSAAITGLGGRLNHTTTVASTIAPVYVADPVVVAKADYNKEVLFTFKRVQTKVRVGIYETVPGYKITSISFYNNDATPAASNYITLNSATDAYFQGATAGTGTITYNWTTTPASYTFAYDAAGLTTGKYWEGGAYTSGVAATSSSEAVANLYGSETNMDASGYFAVLPTPSATTAAPLTIKCDYTLTSLDGSGETINVKGATATIPATYTKWAANTAYTYLFKIGYNTNGTTGTPGTDPVGLYPIVFDAVVAEVADANQGTETSVSTPSITCYQADGADVDANGITFVAGKDVIVTSSETADLEIKKLSAAFDYTKSYADQAYDDTFSAVTATGATTLTLTAPAAATYVIKATAGTAVAYYVLVVGAAEVGPANN